jgi:hypothetical protein
MWVLLCSAGRKEISPAGCFARLESGSVGDPIALFAIVSVLDPPKKKGAEGLVNCEPLAA